MFTYMASITLAEYIRRRKMSLATIDLVEINGLLILQRSEIFSPFCLKFCDM